MSENSTSDGLTAEQLANYPLECRTRFLGLTAKCQTASLGAKRHFIYPEVDDVLDSYLLWLTTFGS
jgi:hypothetical protein